MCRLSLVCFSVLVAVMSVSVQVCLAGSHGHGEYIVGTTSDDVSRVDPNGDGVFRIDTISDDVFRRMQGKSYGSGCAIPRSDLRYLQVSHYNKDGVVCRGELVCNKLIANDLIEIFKVLYSNRYPIERMRLIDDYDGDDERSMRANNTSCFNFRRVAGSKKLSAHSQGLAVDINPLYNPCVRKRKDGTLAVQPSTARQWADRSRKHVAYRIEKDDLCHRLFLEHGFVWGGSWRSVKDYQHFERTR